MSGGPLTPGAASGGPVAGWLARLDTDIQNLVRVVGALTQVFGAGFTIQAGSISDQSADYQVPLTGFSITIPNGISWLNLDPAGALASGTVTMPAVALDGQNVMISSSQAIAALLVLPNGGQTVNAGSAGLGANTMAWWRYRIANMTWYRLF